MDTKDTAVDQGMRRVDSALKIQPHRGYPSFEDLRAVARAILEHIAGVPDLAAEKTPEELAKMTLEQRAAAAHERQVLAAKASHPMPPVSVTLVPSPAPFITTAAQRAAAEHERQILAARSPAPTT